jgi:hypothetical protein
MTYPCFYIFRHRNKIAVDQFMDHYIQDLDPDKNIANQRSINPVHLKGMKALARMREEADRSNMSFFGSFITDDGYHYSVTNINQEDIDKQLVQYLVQFQLGEEFDLTELQKKLKVVETNEGIQLQIRDESDLG